MTDRLPRSETQLAPGPAGTSHRDLGLVCAPPTGLPCLRLSRSDRQPAPGLAGILSRLSHSIVIWSSKTFGSSQLSGPLPRKNSILTRSEWARSPIRSRAGQLSTGLLGV